MCAASIAVSLLCVQPSFAAEDDYIKQGLYRGMEALQGEFGDWLVICSLLGICVALFRKSFKTALGFFILIGGVVILRISISLLF